MPTTVAVTRAEAGASQRRSLLWRVCQAIFRVFCRVWLRLSVRGLERLPAGGALLLSNHQSFLDPMLIAVGLSRPISFLARDSLFRKPVIGWFLKQVCVIPINREAAGTAVIRETLQRLDDGFLMGIFPEGTRTADGTLGEFKPGFAALVRRTERPIVPVGIAGADRALGRGRWFIRPCRVCVVYGEPLAATELVALRARGHEAELVTLVRSRIAACQREAERELTAPTLGGA